MAVNIITSGFLLLVLVAGVQSLIKDLGESCTQGTDTCVHPTLGVVCDTPTAGAVGLCRLKAGETCDAAGGLCVNGALCVSNVCTCQTATYTKDTATGKCNAPTKKWGATCTTATAANDCTGTNALVCTAGACVCTDDTYSVDYATGNCAAVGTDKVGKVCTSLGGQCVTQLSCPAALKCTCNPSYYAKQWGGDCVANSASTVGATCVVLTPTACTGVNEECPSGLKCACKTGFTSVPGGVCFPIKGSLKGGCSVDGDCTVTASATNCTSVASAPKTCKTQVTTAGGNCTDTTSTLCGGGLTCKNNMCTQSDANTVTITAFLVMAVVAVGKLMM